MKKGILSSILDIVKQKCTDTDFICKTADKIKMGIDIKKNLMNDCNTSYTPSPNIAKYYDIHKRVMKEINSNKGKDNY